MKATVETVLLNCKMESMDLFVQILNEITSCVTEEELTVCMDQLSIRRPDLKLYFKYGFGRNHMWVNERHSYERLIFVEF